MDTKETWRSAKESYKSIKIPQSIYARFRTMTTSTTTTTSFHVGCFPDFAQKRRQDYLLPVQHPTALDTQFCRRIIGYFIRDCRNAFIVFFSRFSIYLFFFLFYFIWTNKFKFNTVYTQLRNLMCVCVCRMFIADISR